MPESPHSFHIPVMGLGYTIDTPLKVARFGISSVVSIIEDHLVEKMRKHHALANGEEFTPIDRDSDDARARRITAYLDLMNVLVAKQMERMRAETFTDGTELTKYFQLLPQSSPLRDMYEAMLLLPESAEKFAFQEKLKEEMRPGAIDVNIMTKCDRTNYTEEGEALPPEDSDAMAALRGFAKSTLHSSVVFSAGMNPRLYSYCEQFPDFFPDENGAVRKNIILKVSDFRSATIQGKFLAKKGLWISEFRIESGLNCGGHAFATDGLLMGPILEEFRLHREELADELFAMCQAALLAKGVKQYTERPVMRVKVQGGIGTAAEDSYLLERFNADGTGWGSPFLLVPEATTVDEKTLQQLATAKPEDYFLSLASPLGVPFHNFRPSSSQVQRLNRIEKGRPGSPCYKKFLAFNTEFTTEPICTASRQYQDLKIAQLKAKDLPPSEFGVEEEKIMAKECLCEGLSTPALLNYNIPHEHKLQATAICPGPNLAFFNGTYSLKEMVGHIYGRINILHRERPHMFINELVLYVKHLENELKELMKDTAAKKVAYYEKFKENLLSGIAFYRSLPIFSLPTAEEARNSSRQLLEQLEQKIRELTIPKVEMVAH